MAENRSTILHLPPLKQRLACGARVSFRQLNQYMHRGFQLYNMNTIYGPLKCAKRMGYVRCTYNQSLYSFTRVIFLDNVLALKAPKNGQNSQANSDQIPPPPPPPPQPPTPPPHHIQNGEGSCTQREVLRDSDKIRRFVRSRPFERVANL